MTDVRHQEVLRKTLEGLPGVSFKGQVLKWDNQEDAAAVVKAIKECKGLSYLELEGNTLGVEAALAIGKVLEEAREFKYALWKDLFTGRLKTEIPKALKYLFAGVDLAGARLVRLDLSDNAIGPMAMPGLKPFFESPSSYSLKELILNNNGLGPEGGTLLADCLLECLEASKNAGGEVFSLKVFICGRNRLENKAATHFSKFIRKVKTLEEVQMMQNGIYAPGLKAVAEALAENPNMKVINLNDNTMKSESIDALATSISRLNSLEEISISDCLLKNEGSLTLVKALRNHGRIERVNLESNEIEKEAGIEIAQILRGIPSLKFVNIGSNEFGNIAVQQITQLLREKELEIEDDQGEGGYDDEDDENNEKTDQSLGFSAEEESSSWNISNSISFGNVSIIEVPPINGNVAINSIQPVNGNPMSVFWNQPSAENIKSLQPDTFNSLKNYVRELSQRNGEDKTYSEFCIEAAIKILDVPRSENDCELFENLLIESYDSAPNTNAFSTHLLVHLGLMKDENKKFVTVPVPEKLNAVKNFFKSYTVPKIVCSSILAILRMQMTSMVVKPQHYVELEEELASKVCPDFA